MLFRSAVDAWETSALNWNDPTILKVVVKACAAASESPAPTDVSPNPSDEILIHVHTLQWKTIDLGTFHRATIISEIRKSIERKDGVPLPHDVRFLLGGRATNESSTLGERFPAGTAEATISLRLPLRGGKPVIYLFPSSPLACIDVKLTLSRDWTFSVIYQIGRAHV